MENKKESLESLLEVVSTIDEIFDMFNAKDLGRTANYLIACICYTLGSAENALKKEFGDFKDTPDYQKAVTRTKIIKDKLYKEAQRRDEER